MKLLMINKDTFILMIYSLLVKVIVCFSQTIHPGASYIAFPICLMIFTCESIEKYKSIGYTSSRIVSITLILTLPVRIVYFYETMGSLPEEILGIIGIIAGLFLACKCRMWLLLLFLLAFMIIAYILLEYQLAFLLKTYFR